MDAWSDIRLAARDCRAAALEKAGPSPTARDVVEAMAGLHDLQIGRASCRERVYSGV